MLTVGTSTHMEWTASRGAERAGVRQSRNALFTDTGEHEGGPAVRRRGSLVGATLLFLTACAQVGGNSGPLVTGDDDPEHPRVYTCMDFASPQAGLSNYIENRTDRPMLISRVRAKNPENVVVDEELAQVRPENGGGIFMWHVGGSSLEADPESVAYEIATIVQRFEPAAAFEIPPHSIVDVALVVHAEDPTRPARVSGLVVDYEDSGSKHTRTGLDSFALVPGEQCDELPTPFD
ncbi:MAG: hypothetical protein Q4G34_03790 [Micrococcus sp.]|nr:hypothetical protein [Micrococcus sp.]